MSKIDYRDYEKMSPFEIKDALIKLAKRSSQKSTQVLLNAGRGNPNWIATRPREGFFLFGQFALSESRRTMDNPTAGVAGMPQQKDIAERFKVWLDKHADMEGADFLSKMVDHAVTAFGFDPDAFVFELADSIIGDNYPVPDRMLVHAEQVAHRYLMWAMCGDKVPPGKFDLYAVEGGTAAMCYIFKSLIANRILKKGDTIALGTPIFTPYIEIAELEDYAFKAVHIKAKQEQRFQYSDEEIKKLEDPKIKAFFVVNPGNPTSMAIDSSSLKKIVDLVKKKRPDLLLLTDDVYGTFVPGFRSLMAELPENTIGVYSYSKYFGCTGWRLGVIAIHEKNILDEMLGKLPAKDLEALDKRYISITLEPRKLKMIDRLVADSRDVALNHTAGLSLPQQVMMTMFSISELMDTEKLYQKACMDICHSRVDSLLEGLPLDVQPNPNFAYYYGTIDFEFWLRRYIGEDMVKWLKKNVHPLDLVFKLAEDHAIVLLNGGGFDAPNWSVRVSFANLTDDVYDDIGRAVRAVGRSYVDAFNASKKKGK
ncbi:bifunctional aspartate transaminase/aspartate 4-decarboxylase [Phyllobacterium lublinensis]|uniref:bifunctional aspartate transaminase/aspartate 4-decarboxylase n=1 Tax=Phyllobacterium lublinensis TaxID=2875708 RepID=UPI001CC96831|nr:bifunctional aspartate transaminase/aspartate 4-decarboxylase [Phyllobacterium sp. 2063]MBZ9654836.1 bifunctional aspartate transaminase/aspartate 4-decarboxylase [Phyllobacterium sp. 2063]